MTLLELIEMHIYSLFHIHRKFPKVKKTADLCSLITENVISDNNSVYQYQGVSKQHKDPRVFALVIGLLSSNLGFSHILLVVL